MDELLKEAKKLHSHICEAITNPLLPHAARVALGQLGLVVIEMAGRIEELEKRTAGLPHLENRVVSLEKDLNE